MHMPKTQKQPAIKVSFDKNSLDLYEDILRDSSETHITTSGLIRRILQEHYYHAINGRKENDFKQED